LKNILIKAAIGLPIKHDNDLKFSELTEKVVDFN
jgi:hypothetical protein